MPAAQQMQVQMIHRLPSIIARVYNDPVTAVQLLHACDLYRRGHQLAHQRTIFRLHLRGRDNVLLRNDQQMLRSLRIDIGKADADFVFIHTVRGNRARDDLAKKAIRRSSGAWRCRHG